MNNWLPWPEIAAVFGRARSGCVSGTGRHAREDLGVSGGVGSSCQKRWGLWRAMILESLALRYREVLESLEKLLGPRAGDHSHCWRWIAQPRSQPVCSRRDEPDSGCRAFGSHGHGQYFDSGDRGGGVDGITGGWGDCKGIRSLNLAPKRTAELRWAYEKFQLVAKGG